MKALITAGGKGTRLRPITHTLNKHLVSVCNKPLLFRAIENISEVGIDDIIVNINKGDEELPAVVGDGKRWGVKITYVEQDQPRGLAHVLQLAEPHIRDEDFILYYGDNVLAGGLQSHLEAFKRFESDCHLCLVKVADPSRFGVAEVNGDFVVRTIEKPQEFVSDLAITGIQFYNKTIFEAIKHIKPTPPKPPRTIAEMDIPPANQWLIDNGFKITYSEITGWWKDTGKPNDLLEANSLLLDKVDRLVEGEVDTKSELSGRVSVERGTKIVNSRIQGPVIIGADCFIENCYIGPYTSLASGCSISDAELANSIVLEDCRIENIKYRIEASIIGQGAEIKQAEGLPRSHQLMLGDHSKIILV